MGLALLLWLLVSLLSISLVGNHPLWALGLGAVGGIGIGIFLYRQTTDHGAGPLPDSPTAIVPRRPCLFRRLWSVVRGRLFFPSSLVPRLSSLFSLPLNVPIALLLLLPATIGLYASPDFERSVRDVFQLIAGVGVFYGVVWWGKREGEGERGPSRLDVMVIGFMCLGAVLALGSLLVMAVPTVKLPLMGRLFSYLPNVLPRRVNPNYVGGALVFFAFVPVWLLIWRRGKGWMAWAVAGAVWGGLLLAQSRGALLGAGVALGVTMACQYRWARWLALLGVVGGVFLLVEVGAGVVLDPVGMAGAHRTWEGRAELWQRAIYIAQDFSFTGIGLHTFPVVVDLLYPLFLIGPNARMPHAHNMFLQVAVDMGIPGFVAFWMLLGAWGGMVWESLRRTPVGSEMAAFRPVVLGLSGGMLAHLIYGMTDAITLGEKAGVVFWAMLALTVLVWQQVRRGGDDGK